MKEKKQQAKSPEKKPKPKEQLSAKEWEEIMGINRDTYVRHNGAVRRK